MRLNISGIIMLVIIMLPNIIYFRTSKNKDIEKSDMILFILENIGRISSMFFMAVVFQEYKYNSFIVFLLTIALLAYLVCWDLYYRRDSYMLRILLALLPALIFILSGISQGSSYLVVSGILFGIGHISNTHISAKEFFNNL